jgi:hypothetical protein
MIKRIIVILTLFVSINSFAQKNNTSAYSFFGIGDRNSLNTVEQLSMGGVGVSFNDFYHLNFSNPASVSSLSFTTYAIAVENRNTTVKDGLDNQSAATTYLSYLALGVPVGENGGLSFGLLPNSSVGYSLNSSSSDNEGVLSNQAIYNGEGGTNKVFLNFAYKPFKGLSLGVQGNYIFGKVENRIINQVTDDPLSTVYETISNLKGFTYNVGMQYETKITKKLDLSVGANFDLNSTIDADGNEYLYSRDLLTSGRAKDTILNSKSSGSFKSPLKTSLGVGLGEKNKWFAGVDYSFQDALELNGNVFNSNSKIAYDNYSKIAVGGFYTPKINSISSYWERVTYRAGFKYEKTGLLVDGIGNGADFTEVNDFGISFGVGLPLSQQLSNVNLGFEFGKRGKTTNGLVQENYINFRLSLSLNDKWFKKLEIF